MQQVILTNKKFQDQPKEICTKMFRTRRRPKFKSIPMKNKETKETHRHRMDQQARGTQQIHHMDR